LASLDALGPPLPTLPTLPTLPRFRRGISLVCGAGFSTGRQVAPSPTNVGNVGNLGNVGN
jgi:hypothetical protein